MKMKENITVNEDTVKEVVELIKGIQELDDHAIHSLSHTIAEELEYSRQRDLQEGGAAK